MSNIQRALSRSLKNPVAQHFVDLLNKQEIAFRKCITLASRERSKMLKIMVTSRNSDLRAAISDDVLSRYETRPTLVFSTDVVLTKQQKVVLRSMSGWGVYATVFNLEDRCSAVLIKSSNPKEPKWGMVYPDGSVKTGLVMPIAECGHWNSSRRLRILPKEAPESIIKRANQNHSILSGLKRGVFSITTR